MTYAQQKTPAHYFRLDEAAWTEIGAEYMAGATGAALGAKWKVSASTIYRHAKLRGWSKRHDAADTVRSSVRMAEAAVAPEVATAVAPAAAEEEIDPRDAMDRWMRRELFDPALIARIAASCSGGAFLQREADAAIVFAQIALQHARLAKMMPETEREIVLNALLHREAADQLFSFTRRDGEDELKRAYWAWRSDEDKRLEALRDRVRALEAEVAALTAALPPTAAPC